MSMSLYNPEPEDINYLRKLLASGQITNEQLSGMQMSGGFDSPSPQMQPQPQPPPMQNALAQMMSAQPGQGYQGLQSGQGVIQQTNEDGSQNAPIRIDSRQSQQPQMPERDVTRNPVDLPGGRGYWGKDGQVYTANGSLYQTPETRAANTAMSMAAQDRQLKIQEMQGKMALTDAQTQNALLKPTAPTGPKGQIVDGQWVTFDANGSPTAAAIPGLRPKEGKLTEAEGKATTFGSRMANSHEILNSVGDDGNIQPGLMARTAQSVPLIGGALEMGANKIPSWAGGASTAQKRVSQAQEDFLTADLRLESGAAIGPSEFERGGRQYFPQPGDPAELIAQKKLNREIAIKGFREQSGSAKGTIDQAWDAARNRGDSVAPKHSDADIKHTAMKYGISVDEVKRKLGI